MYTAPEYIPMSPFLTIAPFNILLFESPREILAFTGMGADTMIFTMTLFLFYLIIALIGRNRKTEARFSFTDFSL